jgi:hypothetical protein
VLGFIEIVWGHFDNEDNLIDGVSLIDTLYNVEGVVLHGVTDESFDEAVDYLKAWDYGEAEEVIWDLSSKIGSDDDVFYRDADGDVWGYFNPQHPPVAGRYLITANAKRGYATFYAVIDSEGQVF